MFHGQVADRTERNKVTHGIGFEIPLHPKAPKRNDVMHVQLSPQRFLRHTAALADIAIATAGRSALLSPVRAVVGFVSTLPVEVRRPADRANPSLVAALRTAILAALLMGLFDLKGHATLGAGLCDTPLKIHALPSQLRARHPSPCASQEHTVTLPGTEAAGSIAFADGDLDAADLTEQRWHLDNPQVLLRRLSHRTRLRAVLAGPRLQPGKLFPAVRTRRRNAARCTLAGPRTVALMVRRIRLKRLCALGTDRCFHASKVSHACDIHRHNRELT